MAWNSLLINFKCFQTNRKVKERIYCDCGNTGTIKTLDRFGRFLLVKHWEWQFS